MCIRDRHGGTSGIFLAKISILSLLLSSAMPWSKLEHMLIAQIAEIFLRHESPQTIAIMDSILESTNKNNLDSSNDFVTAANWLDNVKGFGLAMFDEMHYINHPITDGLDYLQVDLPSEYNVLEGINHALTFLKTHISSKKYLSSSFEAGMMLRMLIHLVGDLHQPLHNVARYSKQHPSGDRGGNFVNLKVLSMRTNLHALWDAGGFQFPKVDYSATVDVLKIAKELLKEHSYESLESDLSVKDLSEISMKMVEFAEKHVYSPLEKENLEQISDAYLQGVHKHARYLITLAGYRLSDILMDLTREDSLYFVGSYAARRSKGQKLKGGEKKQKDLGLFEPFGKHQNQRDGAFVLIALSFLALIYLYQAYLKKKR
eukprot:TRINITY_DN3207_c0_g1_i2.p1 TRINITY_DN3207_c0_g1~~TRINITY_DN3207_c0_g1_i2.p1  ORF type:complete len:393 (+),score=76.04 TRINITY_DN3207_c0_g1_i2:61-1179(+)